MSADKIYQALLTQIHSSLTNEESSLNDLPAEEQEKVYTVLNTVFQSTISYRYSAAAKNPDFLVFRSADFKPKEKRPNQLQNPCFCATADAAFTWSLLDIIRRRNYSYALDNESSSSDYDEVLSRVNESTQNSDDLASLFFVGIVVGTAALTFVALYYIISQTLNSLERFWYNEGWLQASLALATMAACGSASGLLAGFLLSTPFTALALVIGLSNPISIIIIGTVCLSLIGAAGGWFITKQVQDYVIKKSNPDALEPQDPHRFELTAEEEANLIEKGMDPLKVKCAMAAIREEMGKKQVPSLLQRLTFSSEKQGHLNKIRKLRRGEVDNIKCFEINFRVEFDLRPFEPTKPANSDDYDDFCASDDESPSYMKPGGNPKESARYAEELRESEMGASFY